jgi:hypothetical protein
VSDINYVEQARLAHPGGLDWLFNDGGRKAAGFKGYAGDCVTRALSIAVGLDYGELYKKLSEGNRAFWAKKSDRAKSPERATAYARRAKRTAREGIRDEVFTPVLLEAGWRQVKLPQGSRLSDLPTDQMIVVSLRKHLVAVDCGLILDTFDSSLGYNRLAFNYWEKADRG